MSGLPRTWNGEDVPSRDRLRLSPNTVGPEELSGHFHAREQTRDVHEGLPHPLADFSQCHRQR